MDLAVFARRDDGFGAALIQPFAQSLAVIAFVGYELGRGRHRPYAKLRNLVIMDVAGRQEQDAGSAFLVTDGVELGVATAFRAADTMSQGPPFPPPAQR